MPGPILGVSREVREEPAVVFETGFGDIEGLGMLAREVLYTVLGEHKAGKRDEQSEEYRTEDDDQEHNRTP